MKALLTSNGITNPTLRTALEELLGKPVGEARALLVATGILPFGVGPEMVVKLVRGEVGNGLATLGWRSLGLLELTALPTIGREAWQPGLDAADVLLVWGGDPMYLAHWLRESGVAEALGDTVYVGTSAGAICAAEVFGETYGPDGRTAAGTPLRTVPVEFEGGTGDVTIAEGIGLVPFAVIPHYENPGHGDAVGRNALLWAEAIPADVYAIDDQSAVRVVDGEVDVVSEGTWVRFTRPTA